MKSGWILNYKQQKFSLVQRRARLKLRYPLILEMPWTIFRDYITILHPRLGISQSSDNNLDTHKCYT